MNDFILEEIARLFGYPCDNGDLDGYMFEHALSWCENNCNKCTPKECWEKYFEIKKENENGKQ